jgi:molybdenum cofactor cytidylyltransferase
MPVPAIILAAGASRRLGHPKQLVLVDGETLLARTMRMAREAGGDPVLVVLGGNQASIDAAVDFSEAHRIINAGWEQGIATSIRSGIDALEALSAEANAVLLLACDQPHLTADHLRSLLEAHDHGLNPVIVASHYKGVPGIPAVFPKAYFEALRRLQGDTGARHILRSQDGNLRWVDFLGGEFDIDSPRDLVTLKGLPARLTKDPQP